MLCPKCESKMAVEKSSPFVGHKTRVMVCPCGRRFETNEKITRELQPATGIPQPATSRQPAGNQNKSDHLSLSDPKSGSDPLSDPSGGDQGVDRARKAKGAPRKQIYPDAFEKIWASYPRKDGKGAALKAWLKEKPNPDVIAAALRWQTKQRQWMTDAGAFIPHLATYLNQRRWEDEPTLAVVPDPPRPDPNCRDWHAGGKNTGKRNPRGQQSGCPECKSVYLREWTAETRPSEPTSVGELLTAKGRGG